MTSKIKPGIVAAIFSCLLLVFAGNKYFFGINEKVDFSASNESVLNYDSQFQSQLDEKTERQNSKVKELTEELKKIQVTLQDIQKTQTNLIDSMNQFKTEQEHNGNNMDIHDRDQSENISKSEEMIESIALQFMDEDTDDTWSDWANEELDKTFQQSDSLFQDNFISSDCRSTLCKIEFEYQNQSQAESGLSELPLNMPWDSTGLVLPDNVLPNRFVVYISREGYSLNN